MCDGVVLTLLDVKISAKAIVKQCIQCAKVDKYIHGIDWSFKNWTQISIEHLLCATYFIRGWGCIVALRELVFW